MRTVEIISLGQVGNNLSVFAVDVTIVDDVDLSVGGETLEFVSSDGNNCVSGLLRKPVDHELLRPLSVVLLALAVVVEDEGGEALNAVSSLDTAVLVSIDLGQFDGRALVGKFCSDLIVDWCQFLAVAAPE
jgi:hypothetical protein